MTVKSQIIDPITNLYGLWVNKLFYYVMGYSQVNLTYLQN